jgi:hypothetical protein
MWSYHGFTPYHSCCSHGMHSTPVAVPWWPPYAAWQPAWHFPEGERNPAPAFPKELAVDDTTPTANAMVGGIEPAHLSMEYEADSGAAAPSIKVTITDSSGTAVWNLSNFSSGFQVKREFAHAEPGAQVRIEGAQVTARLRWFEFLS